MVLVFHDHLPSTLRQEKIAGTSAHPPSMWEKSPSKVNPSLIFNGAISGFVGARGRGRRDDGFPGYLLMGSSQPCLFDHQL